MSTEYGIFGDEGLLEGDFYSTAEAERAIEERYADEDGAYAAMICRDHPEHEAMACELCNADEEESEES